MTPLKYFVAILFTQYASSFLLRRPIFGHSNSNTHASTMNQLFICINSACRCFLGHSSITISKDDKASWNDNHDGPLINSYSNNLLNPPPLHVAYIVDGNGRWATQRGFQRSDGHIMGAQNTVDIVKSTFSLGTQYITLFLFSTENWKRPEPEINNIMYLLEKYLSEFKDYLIANKISVKVIGQKDRLPQTVQ